MTPAHVAILLSFMQLIEEYLQARRKQLQIGGGGGGTHIFLKNHFGGGGGHRYENFRAQMRNLLRLRYEKDGGKDMEIIWRTHVARGTDVKMIEGG